MRTLALLLIAFAAPAAALDDPFPAEAQKAFLQARAAAKMPSIDFAYLPEGDAACADAPAFALAANPPNLPAVDTVYFCSNLRQYALTHEQLFQVAGHELGHMKLRHHQAIERMIRELGAAWDGEHPDASPDDARSVALRKVAVAFKLKSFKDQLELDADGFSTNLMLKTGYNPAHGAFVLNRIKAAVNGDFDTMFRMANPNVLLDRRIDGVMKRVPDYIKKLPARPVESVFEP